MLTPLLLDAFAPPGDDASERAARAERAIGAIEASWSIHLVCDLDDEGDRVRHDVDRVTYLASDERGSIPFLTTPDDEPHGTFTGLVEPGLLAPGGIDELHVLSELPALAAPSASEGLERAAEALVASWAMLTPSAAHAVIVEQVIAPTNGDVPPAGLPRLDLAEDLAPDVPRRLGWINYWSAAMAARLGFDGSAGDLFAEVRQVTNGWIVQLTTEPLDLDRPEHLAALKRAYERFGAIGRRPDRNHRGPA